jgi:hypothetical protein
MHPGQPSTTPMGRFSFNLYIFIYPEDASRAPFHNTHGTLFLLIYIFIYPKDASSASFHNTHGTHSFNLFKFFYPQGPSMAVKNTLASLPFISMDEKSCKPSLNG